MPWWVASLALISLPIFHPNTTNIKGFFFFLHLKTIGIHIIRFITLCVYHLREAIFYWSNEAKATNTSRHIYIPLALNFKQHKSFTFIITSIHLLHLIYCLQLPCVRLRLRIGWWLRLPHILWFSSN